MTKKVFKVTTGAEDKDGFSDNVDSAIVLATTAEEAIKIYKENRLTEGEFIISVEYLNTVGLE